MPCLRVCVPVYVCVCVCVSVSVAGINAFITTAAATANCF